jgi:hypothetical protein
VRCTQGVRRFVDRVPNLAARSVLGARRFLDRHYLVAYFVGLPLFGFALGEGPSWLQFALVFAVMGVGGYLAGAWRPRSWFERYAALLARGGIVAFQVLATLTYSEMQSEGVPWYAVLAVQSALALGFAAGLIRRKRSPCDDGRGAFSLAEYVLMTGVLVLMHLAVAIVASNGQALAGALGDWVHADSAAGHALARQELYTGAIAWAGVFFYSQLMTGLALGCLNTALTQDWVLPPSRVYRERTCMFLLALLPVVPCLLPSMAVGGALMFGVVGRVLLLFALWAFTDEPPTAIFKLLRRRLRGRVARSAGVGAMPPVPALGGEAK